MNILMYLVLTAVLKYAGSQTFSVLGKVYESQQVTLQCTTPNFSEPIYFERNNVNQGGCLSSGTCGTAVPGYQTPTRQGTGVTQMIITSYNQSRDDGSWTCTFGSLRSTSVAVKVTGSETTTCQKGDGCLILIIVGILAVAVIAIIVICTILCNRYFLIVQPHFAMKIMDGTKITRHGDHVIRDFLFNFTWKKHKGHVTLLENFKFDNDNNIQDVQWKFCREIETSRQDIVWFDIDLNDKNKYSIEDNVALKIFNPNASDQGFYEAAINSRKIGIFLGLMIPDFKKRIMVSSIVMAVVVVVIGIILGAVSGDLRKKKVVDKVDFCCEEKTIVIVVIVSIAAVLVLSTLILFFFLWKVHGMELLERSWKYKHRSRDVHPQLKSPSKDVQLKEVKNGKKQRNLAPITKTTGEQTTLAGKPYGTPLPAIVTKDC